MHAQSWSSLSERLLSPSPERLVRFQWITQINLALQTATSLKNRLLLLVDTMPETRASAYELIARFSTDVHGILAFFDNSDQIEQIGIPLHASANLLMAGGVYAHETDTTPFLLLSKFLPTFPEKTRQLSYAFWRAFCQEALLTKRIASDVNWRDQRLGQAIADMSEITTFLASMEIRPAELPGKAIQIFDRVLPLNTHTFAPIAWALIDAFDSCRQFGGIGNNSDMDTLREDLIKSAQAGGKLFIPWKIAAEESHEWNPRETPARWIALYSAILKLTQYRKK